ncbi:lytic transglycosylase domain-containing protein [Dactylosporangium sp. NPDC051484]|uniref:aggregation-promoting factor C-terminal-like domain-containing protein n=1 Tax=Dactylosporangium sp. NPDC051484 TaxID=3154942 RepID=UPI00344C709F
MDDFVIRLWRRVGIIRAVLGLVILAGLVGGLVIAGLQTQHDAPVEPVKAAGAAFPLSSSSATPSVSSPPATADEADALAKAKDAAADASTQAKAADDAARKKAEEAASRSNQRSASASASPTSKPPTKTPPKYPVPSSCNDYSGHRQTGCSVLIGVGFGLDQMPCLDKLWTKESGWNPLAHNKSSNAHGIPQALPGNQMAKFGGDWWDNAEVQIQWGLDYIKRRYKTPCNAWAHSQSTGWY